MNGGRGSEGALYKKTISERASECFTKNQSTSERVSDLQKTNQRVSD